MPDPKMVQAGGFRGMAPAGSDLPAVAPPEGPPGTYSPGMAVSQARSHFEQPPPAAPPRRVKYVPGQAGGTQKTTSSQSQTADYERDPNYDRYQQESLARKHGVAETRADFEIQKSAREADMLRQREAEQANETQRLEAEAAESEMAAQQATGELDAAVASQKERWVNGSSPVDLFDGGSGTGMMLSMLSVALAGHAEPGAASKMIQRFDQNLNRSMRAQEFQVNSLFKQLQNKYGDRDMAKAALGRMQVEYAKTQAERFAAENMAPEKALQLQETLIALDDQAMKYNDELRARAYGKRTETQNFKEVQARRGGFQPLSARDEMDALKKEELQLKNAKSRQELSGLTAPGTPPDSWAKGDKQNAAQIRALDTTLSVANNVVAKAGGQFTKDGQYIKGSMGSTIGGDIPGVGFWPKFVPGAAESAESVGMRHEIQQAFIPLLKNARGTRTLSDAGYNRQVKELTGNWRESQTIAKLEAILEQAESRKATLVGGLTPEGREHYHSVVAPQSQQEQMSTGNEASIARKGRRLF